MKDSTKILLMNNPEPEERKEFVLLSRERVKMSQSLFAKTIGCTPCAVAQWEQGRRIPSNQCIKHLILLLEIQGSRLGTKYGI